VQQPETPGNYRANLAKVGVEGSNPFARAISDTSRNKTANTTSKGERMSRRFKGAIPGKNARIAARTWVLPDAFPG
jgi:hypothetical protein